MKFDGSVVRRDGGQKTILYINRQVVGRIRFPPIRFRIMAIVALRKSCPRFVMKVCAKCVRFPFGTFSLTT